MRYLKLILILFFLSNILNAIEYDFNRVKNVVVQCVINDRCETALELLYEYKKYNPHDCRVYVELANVYKSMSRPHKAKKICLEGIEDAPNCESILYYKLGMLCYSIGDYQESLLNFEKFVNSISNSKIGTNYKKAYKIMGISYLLGSDYTDAIKYLNLAREIDFRDEEIYKYISSVYLKKGDKDYYNIFLELSNLLASKKNIREGTFFNKMGLIFFRYTKYIDAKKSLLKIYKQKRRDYKLNFNIGLTCFFIGKYDEAIPYLEKSVKYYKKKFSFKKLFNKILHIDKAGAKYLLTLSISYYLNKNYEKANQTFKEIKEYNSFIYNKYKHDVRLGENSELYKELKNAWEY